MGSKKPLSIVLISTDYPPLCTSMAVQMRDLAREFALQGHNPIVIIPSEKLEDSWKTETQDGVIVLRLKSIQLRHATYYKRTIAEFALPFIMLYRLHKSPFRRMSIDLVAWYSPTIFFGPLVWFIKHTKKCKSYLILRDIFPEWAVDLGLIKKGFVFWFFKKVANFQYLMANTIGVQTASNLVYMSKWVKSKSHNVEVLQNWQSPAQDIGSAIQIERTLLSGKKIFVYIGNMGIAQGMDIFIDLADHFKSRNDIGFLFVGRGSEINRLKFRTSELSLSNILFFDEIDSTEMPGLLKQCHVGLIALDPRHKTHNIPGKFLTYLLAGLPVLARINDDTDLKKLIQEKGVGRVYVGKNIREFKIIAEEMIDNSTLRKTMSMQGHKLAKEMFSTEIAVQKIIASVNIDYA